MTLGFPNSKKNSFRGNYIWKYGTLNLLTVASFRIGVPTILLRLKPPLRVHDKFIQDNPTDTYPAYWHSDILCSNILLFYTGCAEQGQLGRVAERFVARGGRRGLELLLQPDRVHAKNRRTVFADVWAGSYDTLALSTDNEVLVCGLNNYNQVMIYFVKIVLILVSKTPFIL